MYTGRKKLSGGLPMFRRRVMEDWDAEGSPAKTHTPAIDPVSCAVWCGILAAVSVAWAAIARALSALF
jgi:hypothetical protein